MLFIVVTMKANIYYFTAYVHNIDDNKSQFKFKKMWCLIVGPT